MPNQVFVKSKKAQVGETVTWLVATVIIILILVVFIFISSLTFKGNRDVGSAFFLSEDTLASKSLFSYMLTGGDGEGEVNVYEQLKKEEFFNEINGPLARDIFEEFYGEEYNDVWLGPVNNFQDAVPNDYFGTRKIEVVVGAGTLVSDQIPHIREIILLNEEKHFELVLVKNR